MEISLHLHPTAETVKMEGIFQTESSQLKLSGVMEESAVENTNSNIDKPVHTVNTILSKRKNSKVKVRRKSALQNNQNQRGRNRRPQKKRKKNMRSLVMDTTLATIFSRIYWLN